MFSHIRNRLTFLYTTLTGITLCIFIFAFYFGLSSILFREQEQEALALATEQALAHHEQLEEHTSADLDVEDRHSPASPANVNYFYHAVSSDGRVVGGNNPYPELQASILAQVSSWQTKTTTVAVFTLPKGKQLTLLLAGVPAYDGDKEIGMVFVGKDLAPYYHFLHRLMQALGLSFLIFLVIAALTGHFAADKALIPIKQSFAAQRQFVADASHELRTPLSVFQSSLEVLERKEGAKIAESSYELLADLKDEVQRMNILVSDLLTLARSESDLPKIWKDYFDLRPLSEHVLRSLEHLAAKKNVALTVTAPERLIVYADKDRIAQLLFILVDNGIKFTPSGGAVSVSLDAAENKASSGVMIEVRDTGIGMTPQEQAQIFTRFYRVDKSRSREAGGFGLGLSIAEWIVSAHGGKLSVTSHPGAGSTFSVYIPGLK